MSDTLAGWDARHDACWLFFGAIVSLLFIASLTLPHPWGDLMIALVLAFELVALPVGAVRGRELFVARSLYGLIVLLESHPDRWPDPNFRGRVSRRIERVAEHIEHLPQQLQPGDSVTRAWASDLAQRKAAGVRQLKRWVLTPGPLTFTDLVARLSASVAMVVDGHWYDLPEAPAHVVMKRTVTYQLLLVVLALLALSVSVALLVNRVPGASIISAILGSLAIGLFSKAGLTIATINQAADTAKVLTQH